MLAEEAEAHALEMDERLAKKGAARKIRPPKKRRDFKQYWKEKAA